MCQNNEYTQIMETMKQKEKTAREILNITKEQSQVLSSHHKEDSDNIRQFERLLDKRQQCMDKVDELDSKLSFLKSLPSYHRLPAKPETALQELEKKIHLIFQQATQIDHDNAQKLGEIKSVLSTRMKSLHISRASTQTYTKKKSQVQGFFVDKKK